MPLGGQQRRDVQHRGTHSFGEFGGFDKIISGDCRRLRRIRASRTPRGDSSSPAVDYSNMYESTRQPGVPKDRFGAGWYPGDRGHIRDADFRLKAKTERIDSDGTTSGAIGSWESTKLKPTRDVGAAYGCTRHVPGTHGNWLPGTYVPPLRTADMHAESFGVPAAHAYVKKAPRREMPPLGTNPMNRGRPTCSTSYGSWWTDKPLGPMSKPTTFHMPREAVSQAQTSRAVCEAIHAKMHSGKPLYTVR